MKILFVYGMSKTKDVVYSLRKLGYDVDEYPDRQENSIVSEERIEKIVKYIQTRKITHLCSIHLIYNLAVAAYKTDIKYVSIIWDAPYIKIYTPFGKLSNCWFSIFDKLDYRRFEQDGIPHILYQPLAVNKDFINKWNVKNKLSGRYINDISFVGSIYADNLYDKHINELPASMLSYFTSIFEEAAFRWDGVNRIYGKTGVEMLKYIKMINPNFQLDNCYDIDDEKYFETQYLVRKIANIERICVLNMLSEKFNVTLYTYNSVDKGLLPNVNVMPPVEPGEAACYVYAGSKINLNISLKGIEGGTPQRIMDVMGAGGFMLSNYCAETAELFKEDEEIVMFRTPEELLEKVDYYLSHDEEREAIAKAGQKKVLSCYTYEKKLTELMKWVEGEES